jgi:cell division protein FtsW
VQPSEFLKPAFVVTRRLAAGRRRRRSTARRASAVSLGVTLAVVFLLAMQPDFGQAALVLFGWGVMYFVAGAPICC